ncbi:MAG: GNAT family N-acetyltransferase [Legionellaceae bacterium]|nr:GNAT family N-acetyltransferase [Legionellaceae bacterium]
MAVILETERLILRTWGEDDFEPMCKINQDPKVMEYFPGLVSAEETQALINRICAHQDKYDYTLYAAELKSTHEMIGFIGLLHRTKQDLDLPFNPSTEIGWRLASKHWGQGLAPEGAKAVLRYAFQVLDLSEVVSFTTVNNTKSRRVMEKIGLHHHPEDDFNHTELPKGSPLSRHVLYRLSQAEYIESVEHDS